MKNIGRDGRPESREGIEARIAELEGKLQMPIPEKPEGLEGLHEYRKAIAMRHLRERLYRQPDNTYLAENFHSLFEVVMPTGISRRLFSQIEAMLVDEGVDPKAYSVHGLQRYQLNLIGELIAQSEEELKTETVEEIYQHHVERDEDYVARDASISKEIGQLKRQLISS